MWKKTPTQVSVNFGKLLRTLNLKNICEPLLLDLKYCTPASNTTEVATVYNEAATARGRNID